MELRHLRYFAALAETQNFTRAAHSVHVSQSTLSHQIRQLEDEVGQKLFDRSGQRIVLTESGEVFMSFALRALQEADHGLSALRKTPNELSGIVRLGATGNFNVEFTPECVATFLSRYPTVKLVVLELAADAIASGLKAGQLDLGIAYRPTSQSGLRFEPLYNEEMVLVVSPQHPFARRRHIRMIELHCQKLVLLPETFATRQLLNECFSACRAAPIVTAEVNTVAPMLGLVARTGVAAILSPSPVLSLWGLRCIPIESPTPVRTPGLLWSDTVTPTPAVTAFAAIVRRIASGNTRKSRDSSSREGSRPVGRSSKPIRRIPELNSGTPMESP